MLLTRRIGMSCQWKKEEKTSFKSVIGEQKIGEVWKGVYESVAGERQLGEAFIFIKTDYRHLTQLLLMIPASDLCFYQVWCWKKTHFNTDSSAKIMLACNVHANVWVYYSVNPSLNRMSRGTPERKGESRITELQWEINIIKSQKPPWSERLGEGKAGSLRLLQNPSQLHFCSHSSPPVISILLSVHFRLHSDICQLGC